MNLEMERKFFGKQFEESYNKTFNNLKKNLESFVEGNHLDQDSSYTSDSEDEGLQVNEHLLALHYHSQRVEVPVQVLTRPEHALPLSVSWKQVSQAATPQQLQHLYSLLPPGDKDVLADQVLRGDSFKFGSPAEQFYQLLIRGNFTKLKAQEQKIEEGLAKLEEQQQLLATEKRLEQADWQNVTQRLFSINAHLPLLSEEESGEQEEEEEQDSECKSISSIRELLIERSFSQDDDLDEADRTESENENGRSVKSLEDTSQPKEDYYPQPIQQTQPTYLSKLNANYYQKKKQMHSTRHQMDQEALNRLRQKTVPSIKMGSDQWIENYRLQEKERYQNPQKQWCYNLENNVKVCVAPLGRRPPNTKPREHILLKKERPPYITILSLVRDAAARLPNGVGTRADICELLKESQFINEHIPDDKLSNIVSGALDRLHYEDDPCVKYDNEKKLWLYLHQSRDQDYQGWVVNNEFSGHTSNGAEQPDLEEFSDAPLKRVKE